MTTLPSGTVTLLLTDIEGSTRLLHVAPDAYPRLVSEHRTIIRDASEGHGGRQVDAQGDSLLLVFEGARDAVAAAVDAQRRLAAHAWPDGAELRVRMGLHSG